MSGMFVLLLGENSRRCCFNICGDVFLVTCDDGFFRILILSKDVSGGISDSFYERYQSRFIGDKVVAAFLHLKEHLHNCSARQDFVTQSERWVRRGGYLETLSVRDISCWINSNDYIVTEAAVKEVDNVFTPVADCVIKLPTSDWVVPHLETEIEVYDHEVYQSVLDCGYEANAIIDYLSVQSNISGRSFAGEVRFAGLKEIGRLNEFRDEERKIRNVLGLTFAIQGLEIRGVEQEHGTKIMLSEIGLPEIVNNASMTAISSSKRCPATLLGKWRAPEAIPIVVGGVSYLLHVQWYCFVRKMSLVTACLN